MKIKPEAIYPYHDKDGRVLYAVFRWPDKQFSMHHPDPANPGKYIKGTNGVEPVVYRLPSVINAPPDTRILVVEGEKDADTLAKHGFVATTNRGGPSKWRDEYNATFKDRDIVIIPDNDEAGHKHAENVAKRVKAVAKSVRLLELPDLAEGEDISDWFGKGGTPEQLLELTGRAPEYQPASGAAQSQPYIERNGCLYHQRNNGQSTSLDQLTSFTARIVSDITISDGQRTERQYEIEANVQGKTTTFEIPAAQFAGLNWVAEKLGAAAILFPGPSKEHTRAAIQILSGDVPERRVYSHLGWVKIDGIWYYLHANGAIGLVGTIPGTPPPISSSDLHLPEALKFYKLPQPPTGVELKEAISASLNFLEVAHHRITVPILAAVFAPILMEADSVYLSGPTGAGKTSIAAAAQQHYGPEMDATHLPASYSSTANALEFVGFYAKDALMVVDDFVPIGAQNDVTRLHAQADRLLRGQANRAGRQRLPSEVNLHATRPPRCLILSTGEDIPGGRSLRARMLIVHVGPGDIDFMRLSESQQDASDGKYAQALSAFISYVASDYEGVKMRVQKRALDLRDQFTGTHKRTGPLIGKLASALFEFLSFAVQSEAINTVQKDELSSQICDAFKTLVLDQGSKSDDPAERFIALLKAAMVSGKAHIASVDGTQPPNPSAWGWTLARNDIDSLWWPRGMQMGWLEAGNLYLEPEVAYKVVWEMAGNGTGAFTITPTTLHKRLDEKGLLKTTEKDRGHLTVRKTLQASRRTVLHLDASILVGDAPTSPTDPNRVE
jgi:hypothetical protein